MHCPHTNPTPTVALVSLLILLLSSLLTLVFPLPPSSPPSLLSILADDQFAWTSSTTDVPISRVSVHAKHLLSRKVSHLPSHLHGLLPAPSSDTLELQPVRNALNARRLRTVKTLCPTKSACDFNEQDPVFGLTPMHVAAMTSDKPLIQFLQSRGAAPVVDAAGRLPANLSFTSFIHNARAAAQRIEQSHTPSCEFPVVDFSTHADVQHAYSEARRLVFEGEPVLLRNAYSHFLKSPLSWDVSEWVHRHADVPVTVGAVPYAAAFNLSIASMSLVEYYSRFVQNAEAHNVYVFNKHPDICREPYDVLSKLVDTIMPSSLIVHPDKTGALDGIHFFFGRPGSGAPFHVHADALNAAVNGRKQWFLYTPARTVYSRKPVLDWFQQDLPHIPEEERPLKCVQNPGDVVYVPLDWGHAVLNLDENTFGVALELLNRRDTLAHITGHA